MEQTKRLNGNALKLLAIIAMTIDHLTWVFWPGYDTHWWVLCLHAIGRITAPIMWYFITEGYFYTHNKKKYAIRLLLFAIISHFAYNFCFGIQMIPFATGEIFNQTGVMWALFLGLMALILFDVPTTRIPKWLKTLLFIGICILAFPADWSCVAVMAICALSVNRGNFKKQMILMMICVVSYVIVYCLFIDVPYGFLQLAVALSIPFLAQYNGERGKWRGMKWLFYIYYPAHLFICGLIRIALYGNIKIS